MLRIHHEDTKARWIDDQHEHLAEVIVDAAFKVHSALGPGLLESVYEACLAHELHSRSVPFARQVSLPVTYGNLKLDAGLRLDLVVDDRIVVEVKAVEGLLPVHKAQVLTYLKLSGYKLGFLLNFNVSAIREGIRRLVL